jgi:hypothetical protein
LILSSNHWPFYLDTQLCLSYIRLALKQDLIINLWFFHLFFLLTIHPVSRIFHSPKSEFSSIPLLALWVGTKIELGKPREFLEIKPNAEPSLADEPGRVRLRVLEGVSGANQVHSWEAYPDPAARTIADVAING